MKQLCFPFVSFLLLVACSSGSDSGNAVISDCSNLIAEVNCEITLGGVTRQPLTVEDRDFFRLNIEEEGTLTVWIIGSLDIRAQLLDENGASLLRSNRSATTLAYYTNWAGDKFFYELSAGNHYLVIDNQGSPASLSIRTSFQPALADSCSSAQTCMLDDMLNGVESWEEHIYPINDSDLFEINISRVGELTVWLESELDSRVALFNEKGEELASDDDGGYGYDFRMYYSFQDMQLGRHYLNVSSIFSSLDYPRFGSYELFVQFIPEGEIGKCNNLGEPRKARSGADPLLRYQWYLDRVGVKEAWAAGYRGRGVHISVLDDGLDMTHEDLVENIVAGASRNYLVAEGDPERDNPLPIDCFEDAHGTASAGIAAARGDNGLGLKGVAPEAGIYMANYLEETSDASLLDALTPKTEETLISSNS